MTTKSFRRDAAETMARLEKEFDVDTFEYNGFKIWPAIRAQFGRSYENNVLAPRRRAVTALTDMQSAKEELAAYFDEELVPLNSIPNFLDNEALLKQHKNINIPSNSVGGVKLRDTEVIFATRSVRNYQVVKGKFLSQEDYLQKLLEKSFTCSKLEPFDNQSIERSPRLIDPAYFITPWNNRYGEFIQIKNHFDALNKTQIPHWTVRWKDRQNVLELFKSVAEIEWIDSGARDIVKFEKHLQFIEAQAAVVQGWLKKINPKIIFGNLYTDTATSGLLLAAARLNIPYVEVLNGAMGDCHWHYTHWTKFPEKGYEILPDYFWVWDQESRKSVETHWPSTRHPHKVVTGGNPRFLSWRASEPSRAPTKEGAFFQFLATQKFVILIAHQYTDILPKNMLKVISQSPSEWVWLLRLHPQTVPMKQAYIDIFAAHGLSNVIIEEATTFPLFDLMERSHHLITDFSTTAMEANDFNIEVTLVGDTGKDIFQQYVATRGFNVASKTEEIIQILQRQHKNKASLKSGRKNHRYRDVEEITNEIINDWRLSANNRMPSIHMPKHKKGFNTKKIQTFFELSHIIFNKKMAPSNKPSNKNEKKQDTVIQIRQIAKATLKKLKLLGFAKRLLRR